MSASPRTARTRSSAPRSGPTAAQSRPELRVSTEKTQHPVTFPERIRQAVTGDSPRRMRVFHFVCALVFLAASLVGSLVLRTQMVEDSFAITETQQSIGRLTQDIQERQTKLDSLQASLPNKAQKLGMVPGTDSLTIDLDGYDAAGNAAKGNK